MFYVPGVWRPNGARLLAPGALFPLDFDPHIFASPPPKTAAPDFVFFDRSPPPPRPAPALTPSGKSDVGNPDDKHQYRYHAVREEGHCAPAGGSPDQLLSFPGDRFPSPTPLAGPLHARRARGAVAYLLLVVIALTRSL